MKLKMPITLYDVSVHPKLQNLNYYAKEINFFPPQFTFNQAIHIEIKNIYTCIGSYME